MFIIKDNYYLYINNLVDVNINDLKINKKINIIYRNTKNNFKLDEIIKLRNKCKKKKFKFFVANNLNIAMKCKSDGLYISAKNKKKYYTNLYKIGSAHNIKEVNDKIKQGCKTIVVSRLFETAYKNKKSYLGTIKFNLFSILSKRTFVALGGITSKNLLMLKNVRCNGLAILSELKKKPAISNRLF